MKHALRPFQPGQHNSGAGRLFRPAFPGSSGGASAVCGWHRPKQCDNWISAQHNRKADIAAYHYTAKRMIYLFCSFACGPDGVTLKPHEKRCDIQTLLMNPLNGENDSLQEAVVLKARALIVAGFCFVPLFTRLSPNRH
jgi:hypothetical protein